MLTPAQLTMLRTPSMNDTHYDAMIHINHLAATLQNGDINAIHDAFEQLLQHSQEHYHEEEVMMQEKKFPPYPAHKEEHDQNLQTLHEAIAHFKATENVQAARTYLTETFIPWFLQHTETMDQVTSLFLENSDAHMPYWEQLVPRNK